MSITIETNQVQGREELRLNSDLSAHNYYNLTSDTNAASYDSEGTDF